MSVRLCVARQAQHVGWESCSIFSMDKVLHCVKDKMHLDIALSDKRKHKMVIRPQTQPVGTLLMRGAKVRLVGVEPRGEEKAEEIWTAER